MEVCKSSGCSSVGTVKGYCQFHRNKFYARKFTHGKGRFSSLLQSAKKRGLPMDIGYVEHQALLKNAKCHYCCGKMNRGGSGLDRKDNAIGYTLSNVVTCCKRCNAVKGATVSYEVMLEIGKLLRAMDRKALISKIRAAA
jgi:hypothetical protein